VLWYHLVEVNLWSSKRIISAGSLTPLSPIAGSVCIDPLIARAHIILSLLSSSDSEIGLVVSMHLDSPYNLGIVLYCPSSPHSYLRPLATLTSGDTSSWNLDWMAY
jgi:hypothetical protein